LKYGAGEGWRRSVGPIVWKMKTYLHRVKEERNILQTIKKKETFRWNCTLKHVVEGNIYKKR